MGGNRKGGPGRIARRALRELPGIVIVGGWIGGSERPLNGLRAFVYGEKVPSVPTLPFGRWKQPTTL